jgi:hypothetical protein
MESNMTTKTCKVLKGSIEVPRDSLGHRPLFDRQGHAVNPGVHPGELVDLEADEADRLAALKIVEIMPV